MLHDITFSYLRVFDINGTFVSQYDHTYISRQNPLLPGYPPIGSKTASNAPFWAPPGLSWHPLGSLSLIFGVS